MIDLHIHSTASDGTLSPTELIALAAKSNLSLVSLTDHDTIAGIQEAFDAAKCYAIKCIPGIEFTIEVEHGDFHLLAYGMDLHNEDFLALVEEGSKNRSERNQKLCQMLFDRGIPIRYDTLKEEFQGQIGRPHIAKYLKKLGIVKSVQEGFDKYLANGKPFYLKTRGLELKKALSCIKKANGVSVLAHPMSLYLSWSKLETTIRSLKDVGLDAIEAWNSGTQARYCRRLEAFAKSIDMPVTAGSDFHGKNKPNNILGIRSDGRKIDEAYYSDNLRPLLEASASAYCL